MIPQYESFKGWKGDAFRGCSPVLVDVKTQEAVAGIHLESKSIRTPDATYFWTPLTISNGFEGAPFIRYRLFSLEPDFKDILWMVQIQESTGYILKHFSPKAPLLISRSQGARNQLCDEAGTPLAIMLDVWRDSDRSRAVLKQFELNEPDNPLARPALWSLLLATSDSWFLL